MNTTKTTEIELSEQDILEAVAMWLLPKNYNFDPKKDRIRWSTSEDEIYSLTLTLKPESSHEQR